MTKLDNSLKSLDAAINKLPQESFDTLNTISKLNNGDIKAIYDEIARTLTPVVQAQQVANFASSGLHSKSGDMLNALSKVQLVATNKGWRVKMPSGLPQKEYIKASIAKYGGTRGIKASASTKKKLKKVLKRTGGDSYVEAHHPVMDVTSGEKATIHKMEEVLLKEKMATRKGIR